MAGRRGQEPSEGEYDSEEDSHGHSLSLELSRIRQRVAAKEDWGLGQSVLRDTAEFGNEGGLAGLGQEGLQMLFDRYSDERVDGEDAERFWGQNQGCLVGKGLERQRDCLSVKRDLENKEVYDMKGDVGFASG